MASGYSRSPILLKGALIRFDAPLLIPIPNIIIFQYNPESLSRSLAPYVPQERGPATTGEGGVAGESPPSTVAQRAQPTDPEETFTLRLILDASGRKLAKRDPSTTLRDLRANAWTREQVREAVGL